MTIQEYIDAVAAQLDLPERVVQRIRRDLENELFELVQAGADQQQAIEKMGPVEEAAAKLNEKYADTRPRPKSSRERCRCCFLGAFCSRQRFSFSKGLRS